MGWQGEKKVKKSGKWEVGRTDSGALMVEWQAWSRDPPARCAATAWWLSASVKSNGWLVTSERPFVQRNHGKQNHFFGVIATAVEGDLTTDSADGHGWQRGRYSLCEWGGRNKSLCKRACGGF
jgi:hypothetical protein